MCRSSEVALARELLNTDVLEASSVAISDVAHANFAAHIAVVAAGAKEDCMTSPRTRPDDNKNWTLHKRRLKWISEYMGWSEEQLVEFCLYAAQVIPEEFESCRNVLLPLRYAPKGDEETRNRDKEARRRSRAKKRAREMCSAQPAANEASITAVAAQVAPAPRRQRTCANVLPLVVARAGPINAPAAAPCVADKEHAAAGVSFSEVVCSLQQEMIAAQAAEIERLRKRELELAGAAAVPAHCASGGTTLTHETSSDASLDESLASCDPLDLCELLSDDESFASCDPLDLHKLLSDDERLASCNPLDLCKLTTDSDTSEPALCVENAQCVRPEDMLHSDLDLQLALFVF